MLRRSWSEEERLKFLLAELTGKRPLLPPKLETTAEVADVLGTFKVICAAAARLAGRLRHLHGAHRLGRARRRAAAGAAVLAWDACSAWPACFAHLLDLVVRATHGGSAVVRLTAS